MLNILWCILGTGLAEEAAETIASEVPKTQMEIPFEKYELSNGLDVILSEDHSVPFVQVNVWYDVGSKDEEIGKTGFAHLFEHLMFQGSANHNTEYFAPLQPIGAQVNGTTNFDRTNYFEGVPSEYLPLALWLESDRMGYLLPALTEEKLKNQQDVVRNERRQRYEIRPYGMVWVWLFENLYPEGHPYNIPTIGKHEDIENANMDDVQAFFNKWYAPNNASLVICGDFNPTEAKQLVEQYFGEIPRGEDVSSLRDIEPVSLASEVVVHKEDPRAPQSKVFVAWLTPKMLGEGDAELDVFSSIFAEGTDSPLVQSLVYDKQVAQDVEAFQYSARLQGQYIISATVADGHTTDEVVQAIDEALAEILSSGVTAEQVDISKLNWEKRFYENLQTINRKADILNSYNTHLGEPGFVQQDLERYLSVTPDSIAKTIQMYLQTKNRVVLHITPPQTTEDSSTEEGQQ